MAIVETDSGRIEGFTQKGIHTFLGIPYAAPITPARRFLSPQPVEPWTGILQATELSAVCPQIPTYGPVGRNATSALISGEDFLTVNVRTPSLDSKAPVLFWIHGGGYAVGSANEAVLQSGAFAASGIVEVTVNYRLGVLGFLHLEGAAANRGMLDLIQALQWVRDNIARFGGDPERVTLAGRSAGGYAVAALMAMPGAKRLFSRAMPQSGASTSVLSVKDARLTTNRYLRRLGTDAAGLSAIPIEEMLFAQRDICDESYNQHDYARDGAAAMVGVPLVPVIDGDSLPEHPDAAAAAGRAAQVPMMIGCTTGEYVTHATVQPQDMDYAVAAELLNERVKPLGLTGEEIVARYRRALPRHSPIGIWRAVGGDLVFQNPTSRFALAHSAHQPVFKYLYSAIEPDELGAPHGAEVGNVWYRDGMDVSALPARQAVRNQAFAEGVHGIWASFIAGAPSLPDKVDWPTFSAASPRLARMQDGRFWIERDPFLDRLTLWQAS